MVGIIGGDSGNHQCGGRVYGDGQNVENVQTEVNNIMSEYVNLFYVLAAVFFMLGLKIMKRFLLSR